MSPEEIAELQKKNCIFCKIISGEIPSQKVFENDDVLAILDINPARKGHVLVLPKEHAPILPVIPPPIFQNLFMSAQLIAQAIKEAMLVPAVSIFLANGAIAGQQSPHFLFHLVPRESASDAQNFSIPANDVQKDQESIAAPLKQNIPIMMQNHYKQFGMQAQGSSQDAGSQQATQQASQQATPGQAQSQQQMDPAKYQELKRNHISKMIEENKDVRELLKSDPRQFKQLITQNAQLAELFKGVDVDALSKNLKTLDENQQLAPEKSTEPEPGPESTSSSDHVQENDLPQTPDTSSFSASTPISQPTDSLPASQSSSTAQPQAPLAPASSSSQTTSRPKAEVFLGSDPYAQKQKIFAYFEEKPKAKALLKKDPSYFKELLDSRSDIKELFVDVNIDKLSEKLNEAEGPDESYADDAASSTQGGDGQ